MGRARRIRLLIRDGFECYLCGCRLTVEWSSVDHVIPRSRGGSNADRNLKSCCRRCNKRKGDFEICELLFHVDGWMMCGRQREVARRRILGVE